MKKLEWKPRRKLYSFPAQEQESAKPVATPFSSDIFLTIPVKTNCRPVLTAETAPAAPSPLTLSVFAEQKSESPENRFPRPPDRLPDRPICNSVMAHPRKRFRRRRP